MTTRRRCSREEARNMIEKTLNNSGQTLLEVIVALGVVLSVLITIAGLVMINLFGQKASESRIIAGNLAREGIEAMRQIRDTVKLQKTTLDDFTENEYIAVAHYYVPLINTTNNSWNLRADNINTQLYLKNNTYQYDASGTLSPFKRQLVIDPICQDTANCSAGTTGVCEISDGIGVCVATIGYRIKSEVQWTENNQAVNFSLTDFLYDWQ